MDWLLCRRSGRPSRLLWRALLLLVLGGIVGSCSRGSFIGRQYDDFTAYYNTYYNATKAFEKGLKSISQSTPEVDRTRYISIFPAPQSESGAESSFKEAIQKSADVLREHPNSKWVDDALLLIGKSYFYQQNYVGALQKFREVLALDAEREGEARFWVARTLVTTDRYSDAAEALRTALDNEEDYGSWSAQMHLVRGDLLVRREEWEEAEAALEQGLEGSLPNDVGARAAFLLGQVRETRGDYEEAATAYRRVADYNPRYSLEFAARLSAIEMQGLSGDPEGALARLASLRRGDDTNEMRGEMAVVRARLYQAQGRREEARRILTEALRGDEAPTGTTEGRIHHELGTLYRDAYEDFTRAAAHFDSAATTLSSSASQGGSQSRRQAQVLPRTPADAEAQAEQYSDLAERAQAVARMDSLLRIGRMPPSEFKAFVEKLRKKRQQEREARARERRREQFQGQGGARDARSEESPSTAADTRSSDAGFLFHQDPTLVQRGRRQFRQTWGDRPLVDNWRRLNAIQGSGATAAAGENSEEADGANQSGDRRAAGASLDLSAVPRDSASQAQMEQERAVARYELANSLFRAAGRPDSAETWYRRILQENEDHPVAKQALYALAQAHRAQGDTVVARKTYRRVIEQYPDTRFAKRSRQQLGLDPVESAPDRSESEADSAYAQAYARWQAGNPVDALGSFLTVAESYPETSAAPRALLAAGVVYHRSAQRDTSARRDTVVQSEVMMQRDTLAQDDSLGQGRTTAKLQARLRRFLDRLAQSDSGTTSSDAPADTVAQRESSPSPDSISADSSAETKPSSRSPAKQKTDTSNTAPQSEQPPDSVDGAFPSPRSSTSDTTREESAVQRPQRRTTNSREPPDSGRAARSSRRPEAPSADTTAEGQEDRADSTEAAVEEARPIRADTTETGLNRRGDSTAVAQSTDSSAIAQTPDTSGAAELEEADSTRTDSEENDQTDPLKALLTYLTEQYPDTPPAKRAHSLLDHFEQRAVASDSAAADTTAVDSVASGAPVEEGPPPDSTTAPPPRDTTVAPDSARMDTASGPQRTLPDTLGAPGPNRQPPQADSTLTPRRDSASVPPTPKADTTRGRRNH